MEFHHVSVMLDECIEGLNIAPDGIYLDGTVGGAGHSAAIAGRLSAKGRLVALDQDPTAIQIAEERLKPYPQAQVVNMNFRNMDEVLAQLHIERVNGILLDLGVSSHQLDMPERGFSYHGDTPLDMRMSQQGMSAKELVNTYSVSELCRILREYGEEPFAFKIAQNIIKAREKKEIETTGELAAIIGSSVPAARKREKNPCKRSFQAIRIAVNAELDSLSTGLDKAFESLADGGRLVILTFHSLEDRMVKQRFASWCTGCICPPGFPICICGNKPRAKLINRKPLIASEEELAANRRSKSAKLRILEKIERETPIMKKGDDKVNE